MKNLKKSLWTAFTAMTLAFAPAFAQAEWGVPDQVSADTVKKAEKKFGVTGTFLQINNEHMQMAPKQWQKQLRALHSLGNDTFIIQYSAFNEYSFIPEDTSKTDAIEMVLDYADKNGLSVFVGTAFDSRWITEYNNVETLEKLIKINEEVIAKLWARYGKHKSFTGWYLPYETMDWDFSDLSIFFADVYNQRHFITKLAEACRKASDRPVKVMSGAYFLGKHPAGYVELSYTELLKDTGLDIFLLQDGFGVRNWRRPKTQVTPYLEAFQGACEANGIEFWVIIESFAMSSKVDHFEKGGLTTKMGLEFVPADLARLQKQVKVSRPYAKKMVQFDALHYMNPFHVNPDRLKLYQEVRALIEAP